MNMMEVTGVDRSSCLSFWGILLLLTSVFNFSPATDARAASAYEGKLLEYINDYRVSSGLARLTPDRTLERLAGTHSRHMSLDSVLDHDNFDDRFRQCGRSCCVENVGWNYLTPEAQFRAWKGSEGHNKNLLNKEIRHAGISKIGPYVTFFACD